MHFSLTRYITKKLIKKNSLFKFWMYSGNVHRVCSLIYFLYSRSQANFILVHFDI